MMNKDKPKYYSKWDSRSMKEKLDDEGIHLPFGLRKLTYEDVLNLSTLSYKEKVILQRMIRNDRMKARNLGMRKHGNRYSAVERGKIFLADLNDKIGSEQKGIRPVLVIQNDTFNLRSPTTIVAPITTKADKKPDMLTHIPYHNVDEDIDVMVLLEQITTIDKSRLLCFIGDMQEDTMKKVEEAAKYILSIEK